MGMSQYPCLGQLELHQPHCKASGNLRGAGTSAVHILFYFQPVCTQMQIMTKQEAVQEEGPPAITCSRDNFALSASS